MILSPHSRRVAEAALILLFLVFGGAAAAWVQWQLDRSFAQMDPSGLTIPFPLGRT